MRILATSDIHGNKALVYFILRIVEEQRIDALIRKGLPWKYVLRIRVRLAGCVLTPVRRCSKWAMIWLR
jgi:hypothetical protein